MGKELIIKGADFYENAIRTGRIVYYNNYSEEILNAPSAFTSDNKFYMLPAEVTRLGLGNKSVSYAKLYAKASGNITIGLYEYGTGNPPTDEYTYTVQAGLNIIELGKTLVVTTTMLIMVGGNGIIPMWSNNNNSYGWKITRPGQSASTYATLRVPISFGYREE